MKPFAESSEQNKDPIYAVLKQYFNRVKTVLEIGSGTGQHAVFFADKFTHLLWMTSDQAEYHKGIKMWLDESSLQNVQGPLLLDVNQDEWPLQQTEAIFSANTVHIMSWPSVENMFAGIGRVLATQGIFCLYGPFNYNGEFSSESNARFDLWLKQRDPESGVRDFAALQNLAEKAGLEFVYDHEMPANNRILVWQKK
ncbi:MAG: class I SAM-dependent methyltransferase [Gammaproteobacteria bacterium]|nr:class I SAM-dependent methyltransferase [Gammaproteobacteria bacterium]MCW8987813.1 class I SAM-dependent methyltransferase [Gammaproteobacteria bacterium]MCW9031207.1 class I SAM-dependent methyltransferase [Gammaproteobacteria bacterium]